MAKYSTDDFARMAIAEFPQLREEFEEDADLPHVQMAAFARLTEKAKGAEDWETYRRCIRLTDELWRSADEPLKNALYVSYLEHITFDSPRGLQAWHILTPDLREGWREMERFWEEVERWQADR